MIYPSPLGSASLPRTTPCHPPALHWHERLALLVAGGTLLVLLAIAAWLEPRPEGVGTHEQLGLPPCTMRFLFHLRCPSCGMTTSWAHLMNGNVLSSLRSNAGGMLLGLAALAAGPWLTASAVRGRWLWAPPGEITVIAIAILIILVTLADWCVRLSLGS